MEGLVIGNSIYITQSTRINNQSIDTNIYKIINLILFELNKLSEYCFSLPYKLDLGWSDNNNIFTIFTEQYSFSSSSIPECLQFFPC